MPRNRRLDAPRIALECQETIISSRAVFTQPSNCWHTIRYLFMFVTNTDRVRAELEKRIVDGTLAPGTTLDETLLCRMFDVSRTPVREALLQLSAEGYVRIVPRAGIYVVQLSAGELCEMFESLAYFEGLCAGLAAKRITDAQLKKARYLQNLGGDALQRQDIDDYREYDKAFHECVYNSCGNGYLTSQLVYLRKRIHPYRRHHAPFSFEQAQVSWDQHQTLLDALQRREEVAARLAATRHVEEHALPFIEAGEVAPEHLYFGSEPRQVGDTNFTGMPRLFLASRQRDETLAT
jgi:DNA-binding GntR family transcriptional regulator